MKLLKGGRRRPESVGQGDGAAEFCLPRKIIAGDVLTRLIRRLDKVGIVVRQLTQRLQIVFTERLVAAS